MQYKRIKVLNGYAPHARYLCEVEEEPVGSIPTPHDIPSPFAYSPTTTIMRHSSGKLIFIKETKHRRYEVFEFIGKPMSEDDATAEYLRQDRLRTQAILVENCKGLSA